MSGPTVSADTHHGPAAPRPGGRRWGPVPEDIGFGRRFVAATSFGAVLNPINSSIIAIALVSIGRSFDAGGEVTWLVSALYLATAVGQPTMGRLADRLGPRRVYLAGTALVGAAGLIGYAASSLAMLVVVRVLIGLGTSAAYPAAMAMVRRQSQRLNREAPGGVLGALAIAGQVTMAVGPPLGGLLIAAGGWRLTFLINVPLALTGIACALAWLPADEPGEQGSAGWRGLDPAGLALFCAGLTGLMVFLMDLAAPRWWLLGVSLATLTALVAWESRAETPFIDVRMLARNRGLTVTYLRFAVTMLVTYSFIYGWTQWLEQSAGQSAFGAGALMMPSFAVAAVASAITSVVSRRRLWGPLLAGTAALLAGSGALLLLGHHSSPGTLIAVSVVFGAQNGVNGVANQAAMYAQAPAAQTGAAAGLLRTFMYLGAIASASLIGFTYRGEATDGGLHRLALILTVASAILLVTTFLDKALRTGTDR
jgi:MFS family permease